MKQQKNALLTTLIAIGFSTITNAQQLKFETFNPGAKSTFNVASTLITGSKNAVLVDAQFQKNDAEQVVEMIKKSKKNLEYIFISHSDPDYYFGLETLKKNFPNTKIIATAQTAYLIDASKNEKLAVWKDVLKENAPQELITPTAYTDDKIILDGQEIDIKKDVDDPAHTYLWVPSSKAILGGVYLSEGGHLWLADTQDKQSFEKWIKQLDKMKALNPTKVIPSHYSDEKKALLPTIIDFDKKYIQDFVNASANSTNSAELAASVKKIYPGLPGESTLEMSAKVNKNEMKWEIKSPYLPIERNMVVDFGKVKFRLTFKDNLTMNFKNISATNGDQETVNYKAVEVAKNVFMVYWHELQSGDNVVHVQDFNNHVVYTNIAGKDGSFIHLKGTLILEK